jgi:peptidoglycan/xylan/chitin deacetylase (PgdA/CDA1 family)
MGFGALRLATRRAATLFLGSEPVNSAVRTVARLRGHGLVLLYHRVGPPLPAGCEVVPSVTAEIFRAHLQALGESVDLVRLEQLVSDVDTRPASLAARSRPAVALTFDDDLSSHVRYALPVLCDLGMPATFFLSGRALHGLGPYWFQCLEALLVSLGQKETAALLNLPAAPAAPILLACMTSAGLRRQVCEAATRVPSPDLLDRQGIAALGAAGMTIGFHTIDHLLLPGLDESALPGAVSRGRDELASVAGTQVRSFAYPFGKADARSAAAVRNAGFLTAFTGRPAPLRQGEDPYQLGRWEPGPLCVDDFMVKLAVRLHRAAPVNRDASP